MNHKGVSKTAPATPGLLKRPQAKGQLSMVGGFPVRTEGLCSTHGVIVEPITRHKWWCPGCRIEWWRRIGRSCQHKGLPARRGTDTIEKDQRHKPCPCGLFLFNLSLALLVGPYADSSELSFSTTQSYSPYTILPRVVDLGGLLSCQNGGVSQHPGVIAELIPKQEGWSWCWDEALPSRHGPLSNCKYGRSTSFVNYEVM